MISGHCNENGKNKNININTQKKQKAQLAKKKNFARVAHFF